MADKFNLKVLKSDEVIHLINEVGAKVASGKDAFSDNALAFVFGTGEAKSKLDSSGIDTHEGRKALLKKLGVDSETSADFRLVSYTNDFGQEMIFKGRMDGDKKLILTDSLPISGDGGYDRLNALLQGSFKSLPKPIEVKVDAVTPLKEGAQLEISPEERKKLETQASLASAIQKSGDSVQLTSNARIPSPQQISTIGLNT